MDGLERLITQGAQPFSVLTKRVEHLRVHPSFGADDKEATLVLDAAHIVEIEIATIRQEQTGPMSVAGSGKNACSLVVSGVKTTVGGASQSKSMVV